MPHPDHPRNHRTRQTVSRQAKGGNRYPTPSGWRAEVGEPGSRRFAYLKEVPLPLSRGAGIRNAKVGRPGATCGMPSAMG